MKLRVFSLQVKERSGGCSHPGAPLPVPSSIPKSGTNSLGVARQWCGTKGKQDNCHDAASTSLANMVTSLPCAFRLFLPQAWCRDTEARKKAGVPATIPQDHRSTP